MNGWPTNTNSDKYRVRNAAVLHCNFDVCGIAETHLIGNDAPCMEGYAVFNHNRDSIHIRARCGSGGVCLLVKKSIMISYNVSILDNTYEDILWVRMENKFSQQCVNVCVCYLSPDGSSHIVDPHDYFDKLLSQIYIYQSDGPFIICGDFNSRCGSDPDYIVGVDEVPEREIIDYKKNHYGDLFTEFLINSNCAMLNGRCKKSNDYTSISTKGLAVVDYVMVSHMNLDLCTEFDVIRAHELFNKSGLVGKCDPDHNISDHSVLAWQYQVNATTDSNVNHPGVSVVVHKYDVSDIPQDFMANVEIELNITDINQSYNEFCSILKLEMDDSLPAKHITINSNPSYNRHTRYKPWWTERLTILWDLRCKAERDMNTFVIQDGKQKYLEYQKQFDRAVRDAKRQYWNEQQQELIQMKMSRDFWKTFGKAGVQNEKKQQIPWQIVNSDNSICYDPNIVLEKWKSKFEQLLNPEEGIVRATPGEMLGDYPVIQDTTTLNADITIE